MRPHVCSFASRLCRPKGPEPSCTVTWPPQTSDFTYYLTLLIRSLLGSWSRSLFLAGFSFLRSLNCMQGCINVIAVSKFIYVAVKDPHSGSQISTRFRHVSHCLRICTYIWDLIMADLDWRVLGIFLHSSFIPQPCMYINTFPALPYQVIHFFGVVRISFWDKPFYYYECLLVFH